MSPSVVLSVKKMDLKIIVGTGSNKQKMLENQRYCKTLIIFLRTVAILTIQNKQGSHEQQQQK